jgi:hypothetical protein
MFPPVFFLTFCTSLSLFDKLGTALLTSYSNSTPLIFPSAKATQNKTKASTSQPPYHFTNNASATP